MDNYSFLGNGDIGNFDHLFEQFRQDPESVDESWRRFFEGFEFSKANYDQAGIDASIITSDETWKLLSPFSEFTM